MKGTVTDDMDEPAIGATVKIQGTNTGTLTDMDGKYSLDINDSTCVLEFYYMGCKSQEKHISEKGSDTLTVNVKLELADKALCDIVVVGYGTTKKSNMFHSRATVSRMPE
ncbi:MAG: carboxypeptidase-like regulatory domain-containing protein, partial [Paludibacteraceae bacterium]|nr:carboxypeptidase-like regulatory domain-containing protein [Paludibacteraceae bacterium]